MKGKILLSLAALFLVSGSLTAFAGSTETPDISIEQSAPMQLSTVMIRQDEDTLTSSYDGGNTWNPFSYGETHKFYSHNEFSAWIKEQETEISALVEAGEWTQEEADAVIHHYYELLERLDDGLFIGKRESDTDDHYFISYPNAAHTEGFQTVVYTENGYKFIGPYDTEKELYEALEAYTELQVGAGIMTADEAKTILRKYK